MNEINYLTKLYYLSSWLQIGKPCTFVVNFNGAQKGNLQARVVTPSGAEDDVLVQEIDEGKCGFVFESFISHIGIYLKLANF